MLALKKKKEKEEAARKAAEEAGNPGAAGAAAAASTSAPAKKRTTAAEIRITKDLSEIDIPPFVTLNQVETKKIDLVIDLATMESIWQGGKYNFTLEIPNDYPHKAPKAHLLTPIYHPNIDLDGNVCLNILRDDWSAVGDINLVVNGLIFLFLEPNPDDPLNHEAAAEFRNNIARFKQNVTRTLRGEYFQGRSYPKFK